MNIFLMFLPHFDYTLTIFINLILTLNLGTIITYI